MLPTRVPQVLKARPRERAAALSRKISPAAAAMSQAMTATTDQAELFAGLLGEARTRGLCASAPLIDNQENKPGHSV